MLRKVNSLTVFENVFSETILENSAFLENLKIDISPVWRYPKNEKVQTQKVKSFSLFITTLVELKWESVID